MHKTHSSLHIFDGWFFSFRYLDHVRQESADERAGGYTREYPCLRAIEEAFDMLLFVKENSLNNVKNELREENEPMETWIIEKCIIFLF